MFSRVKILKGLKWVGIALGVFLVVGTIWRIPYVLEKEKTLKVVAQIHATKLTLDDVMGKNLPLDPGPEADKTVVGIDANKNGIRDDVELAIFKEYPDSPKTRAALLQYAMALQISTTLVLVNPETITAIIEDSESRALNCLWSISSRDDMDHFMKETTRNEDFVKKLQLNTEERVSYAEQVLVGNLKSYTSSNAGCDVVL